MIKHQWKLVESIVQTVDSQQHLKTTWQVIRRWKTTEKLGIIWKLQ